MMSSWPEHLLWSHYVVAQTATGAAGLVSENVLCLAVAVREEEVTLHAVLARESADDLDDLNHVRFELDVLLDGHTAIALDISVGFDHSPWPPEGWRVVYLRKGARGG